MKAKLIKTENGYGLEDVGIIAFYSSKRPEHKHYKLSKQNCDEIFGVVDVDKLGQKHYEVHIKRGHTQEDSLQRKIDFIIGFNEAMELNKDKLFTVEDFNNFIDFVINEKSKEHAFGITNKELINCHLSTYAIFQMKDLRKIYIDTFIQSLQQPIEVEVEMEPCFYDDSLGGFSTSYTEDKPKEQPKLDSEEYLILKKI
jgi:hypothetical protein